MGFKHLVSASIQSFHESSDTLNSAQILPNGDLVSYPSYIIGQGSNSQMKIYSNKLNNSGYGIRTYAMFNITVPTGATVTKVWCEFTEYVYQTGTITKDFALLKRYGNTWAQLTNTKTLIDSADDINRYKMDGTGTQYFPTVSEVPSLAISSYYYASSSSSFTGLLGGATMYVEYEDDTPDTHGIFNLILPRG